MVVALGTHDRRTRGHSERVRAYAEVIAEEVRLPADARNRLRWAALLHDIGKLAVHPHVLQKDAALDDDEWEQIRRHPEEGARAAPPPPARFAVDDQVTTAGPVRVPVLANDGAAGVTIDPSTLEILDGPSHSVGHRGGTGGAMTGDGVIAYIPEPRFVGVDSITYRVCSTVGRCDVATVVFTVTDR